MERFKLIDSQGVFFLHNQGYQEKITWRRLKRQPTFQVKSWKKAWTKTLSWKMIHKKWKIYLYFQSLVGRKQPSFKKRFSYFRIWRSDKLDGKGHASCWQGNDEPRMLVLGACLPICRLEFWRRRYSYDGKRDGGILKSFPRRKIFDVLQDIGF